jgi:DNA-binding CsgD family transcriptional regulator
MLKPWIDEQLQTLLSVKNKDELITRISKATETLEFDNFAYGLRLTLPLSKPKFELINNYPLMWKEQYAANDYVTIDPTVQHGLSTTEPLIWTEELFSESKPLWEDAKSMGLKHGWAQSVHSHSGVTGMLTLSRHAEPLEEKELINKTPFLVWLTQITHIGLQKKLLPKMQPSVETKLTPREVEILRWTADGKTSYEISIILSISERTVNFHINNVFSKLNINNKTAAVVQAVILGLI